MKTSELLAILFMIALLFLCAFMVYNDIVFEPYEVTRGKVIDVYQQARGHGHTTRTALIQTVDGRRIVEDCYYAVIGESVSVCQMRPFGVNSREIRGVQ